MVQLVIGLICSFFGVSSLFVLFNLHVRWPTQLGVYKKTLEQNNTEENRVRYVRLKSLCAHLKAAKPFLWICALGLLLQGIYSLITGLSSFV